MSSIQDGWSFLITVSPNTHWEFNSVSFSTDVIDSPKESVLAYLEFVSVTHVQRFLPFFSHFFFVFTLVS